MHKEPTDSPLTIPTQRAPAPTPVQPDPASTFEAGEWLITGEQRPAKPVQEVAGSDGHYWMYGVQE